jgi:alkylation response protein AidB-like acyl-CoA dehydrogenase
MAGAMRAAVERALTHVQQRHQFGRPIGSFQALQHRLATLHVAVEGTRWLALEAAWHGAPAARAATAAAHAAAAAALVFRETHQMNGAIGFTREHELCVHSLRLQTLRVELGGVSAHRRALASARWRAGEELGS